MKIIRFIFPVILILSSMVLYQNCDPELNQDGPSEVSGQRIVKSMPGVVDLEEPINIAPSMDGGTQDGIQLNLLTGAVITPQDMAGECLETDLLENLRELLTGASVCQDEVLVEEGEEVFCTMEFNFPWAEIHITGNQDWVGLGEGNNCPRTPTYFCENNDALKSLIGDIDDEDFIPCP